jgi:hypothetical protein
VEIAGWRTRGHGPMRVVEGVVGHHTATAASAPGDYPSLGIVTNGRSDLAGPLAGLGLGRDGTVYVIAAGLCYHAGASKWAGYVDLNDEYIGIEAESSGHGDWTPAQRDCYPKLVAALLKYMSRGVDRYAGHKDVCVPIGRKPDPVGIDTGWMRATAQTYLTNGIQAAEDDMGATETAMLQQLTNYFVVSAQSPGGQTLYDAIWQVRDILIQGLAGLSDDETKIIAAVRQPIDLAELATLLATLLAPTIQGGGATEDQVRTAVDDGIRQAFSRAGESN